MHTIPSSGGVVGSYFCFTILDLCSRDESMTSSPSLTLMSRFLLRGNAQPYLFLNSSYFCAISTLHLAASFIQAVVQNRPPFPPRCRAYQDGIGVAFIDCILIVKAVTHLKTLRNMAIVNDDTQSFAFPSLDNPEK